MKQIQEHSIYSLALTPYQYVAHKIQAENVNAEWLLVPEWPYNKLIGGPALYVTLDGRIGTQQGLTERTTADLDFTGRYTDAREQQPANDNV